MSKSEAEKTDLHEEDIDVPAVLEACNIAATERARSRSVAIERESAADAVALHTDGRNLKQFHTGEPMNGLA